MIAGILAGLAIMFFGLGEVLFIIQILSSVGGYLSGEGYGLFGTMLAAFIVSMIIGIFVLIFGIKKSYSIAKIAGFMVFIYFIMFSIFSFIARLTTEGILLVLGAAFILLAVILSGIGGGGSNYMQDYFQQSAGYYPQYNQSSVPIGKVIGYSFGLVGIILAYLGINGIVGAIYKFMSWGSSYLDSSYLVASIIISYWFSIEKFYFGNNILGMVAGIIAMIGLLIHAFSKSSNTTKHIANIILEVGLILLGVGQMIVGAGIIANGGYFTLASGSPGVVSASIYMIYIGGIIDLIAGIFAIIVAIFFMIEDIMKMSGRLAEEAI
jgi:hypothetical protein